MGGGRSQTNEGEFVLGIEGGGTRTSALFVNPSSEFQQRLTFGPLNLKLSTDGEIRAVLRRCRNVFRPLPSAVAICLAGCRTPADHARVRQLAASIWPRARLFISNDLVSGHAAAFGEQPGILAIAGTGSVVFGRNSAGKTARAGGWGHLLGDHASAYWLALRNLQLEVRHFDLTGKTSRPLQQCLRQLCLNTPDQLVDWMGQAGKEEVAGLAPLLTGANPALLREGAQLLAADIRAVAARLHLRQPAIFLAGGCARNARFVSALRQHFPRLQLLQTETVTGAICLASGAVVAAASRVSLVSASLPLTEQRNPRTLDLDRQTIAQLITTMLREDERIIPAIRRATPAIEQTIKAIVRALRAGGRLFYVGAGTSGRLGVLDASECPPTFSTNPDQVQAIIAGGLPALTRAVEAAEDDAEAGKAVISARGVTRRDVVIGIAASGRTPFVLGALDEAKRRDAKTFLLSFSPPGNRRHTPITILTGPEVLTGSTRLKAGTATKLVLNLLTTITMIRLGKVVSNLMVDVRPTNAKLRARAARIVAILCGCGEEQARQRLEAAGWDIKRAVRRR